MQPSINHYFGASGEQIGIGNPCDVREKKYFIP
jgi:hypothetical protein